MGKRPRSQKKGSSSSKRSGRDRNHVAEDMDDEIDTFHKQRDFIPLDTNEDAGESDEDNETPVLDFKGISEDEDDDDDDGSEDDDDISDDGKLPSVAAKIARTQKFLRAKFGGVEDEMHEEDEAKEDKTTVWGGSKNMYYEYSEVSSSEEEEEEAEVLRLQKERAKNFSMEDFGLEDLSPDEDEDEDDKEPSFEDLVKGKATSKSAVRKEAENDGATTYEEVKKDLNSLTKEEQMDVVYSSAPELVGLLSELSETVEQLERINLLISKVKKQESTMQGGMRYLEVKQLLLLSYCQAITFYLLLKSEGQPVRDHPIIARLVEIKSLLDKTKELDKNLPSELDEILENYQKVETESNLVKDGGHDSVSLDCQASEGLKSSCLSTDEQDLTTVNTLNANENKRKKYRHENERVGVLSAEMLKLRAALEEKLKKKGVFNNINQKPGGDHKRSRLVATGKLETLDDFDDDAMAVDASHHPSNGRANSLNSVKFAKLISERNKGKIISGDDDLPKRDDIGERRRKHELRVLASAGVHAEDDIDGEVGTLEADEESTEEESENEESEDEFYRQVKKQRAAKLAEKAEIYSRTSTLPSLPEVVDGKRHISQQMEKNRGLTRNRKKLNKNPRKKYRNKHQKAVVRRKGQVRDVRKATGPYGGETTGINATISRSVRFKS